VRPPKDYYAVKVRDAGVFCHPEFTERLPVIETVADCKITQLIRTVEFIEPRHSAPICPVALEPIRVAAIAKMNFDRAHVYAECASDQEASLGAHAAI
jgi:hypothetical protein